MFIGLSNCFLGRCASRWGNRWSLTAALAAALACTSIATADETHATERIRDNLFILEEAYNQEPGDTSSKHVHRLVVSPGARFAINHPKTRLQVVPGIAVPLQVLPRDGFESAVLTYLSFEHPAF